MNACPTCEAEVPPDAPGELCPRCILKAALAETLSVRRAGTSDSFPIRFGKYELLNVIARGGMGIVYRARQPGIARDVALKKILSGVPTDEELRRFMREARTAATFTHPNIVRILDVDEHEGSPYFTMELIEGGSLADHPQPFRWNPRRAIKLVADVARAVSYAHQRGVLHRDLKPANILLDAEGSPRVTDFGLAKHVGNESGLTLSGAIVGTLLYMSPEQAMGRNAELTTGADVYSLGAILYELLTGRPPIVGDTFAETLRLLQESEPIPPRKLNPSIPRDLEALCLRCLAKNPEHRYTSTALAEDLERFLRNEPLAGIPRGSTGVVRWLLQHPVVTTIAAEVALLVVVGVAATFWLAAAQAHDRPEEITRDIGAAQSLAESVRTHLMDYRDALTQAAADFPPILTASLLQPWPEGKDAIEGYCRENHARYDKPGGGLTFPGGPLPTTTWLILDKGGVARAQWPTPQRTSEGGESMGKAYAWRDYFQGARALALERQHSAYVSRAFLTEVNNRESIALSAPLYGADGTWLGVIVAIARPDTMLDRRQLRFESENRIAELVAAQDRTREAAQANAPLPSGYAFLFRGSSRGAMTSMSPLMMLKSDPLHDPNWRGHGSGPAQVQQNRPIEQLQQGGLSSIVADTDDYRDPLAPFAPLARPDNYVERWLAAFAPVGNTNWAVIVQTPYDVSFQFDRELVRRLVFWAATPSEANAPAPFDEALVRRLAFWGGLYAVLSITFVAALMIARRRAVRVPW